MSELHETDFLRRKYFLDLEKYVNSSSQPVQKDDDSYLTRRQRGSLWHKTDLLDLLKEKIHFEERKGLTLKPDYTTKKTTNPVYSSPTDNSGYSPTKGDSSYSATGGNPGYGRALNYGSKPY
ncbi:MAG: hypothetical protein KKA62_06200 [Nanoarchaeota archaeon]|nr:hypothetical protein [Nanoarchaeota archaeon]MBU1644179.1 hypothetical protein [Nanoarchaeota archaeon]MBU1977516.1 hypothetical protein [Nanoarchaeota archaeon]